MSLFVASAFFVVVFLTSALSGIFGMAGGLVLLWFLLLALPATSAIVVHGVIQLCANASRAWFSRHYIDFRIVTIIASGGALAALGLALVNYSPNTAVVSLLIGLMPLLVWMPKAWFHFDASRASHAFGCGLVAGGLTIAAGVSGPTIDLFFIRTAMDRRQIVATKAAVQVISHAIKIVFYLGAAATLSLGQWGVVLLALPLAIFGTHTGNAILRRLTDANFRTWTRWIVTVIGTFYFLQGVWLLS